MSYSSDKRLIKFTIIIALIFLLLIGRLYYLQIYKGDIFKELSEGNRTSLRSISAPRGKIYDRNKKVLVSNKLAYTLSIIPNEVDDVDLLLDKLTELIKLDYQSIKDKISKSNPQKILRLKRNISREELILLEEYKSELPGIILEKVPMREYVYEQLASHVLGYVGEISASKLDKLKGQGYDVGDVIGKTGLELYYEDYLQGKEGKELVEVNNVGEKVRTLGIEEPISGYDLVLNLDYDLQSSVEKILKDHLDFLSQKAKSDEDISEPPRGGAVIVMNPDDSSILAMASLPEYDSNVFVGGISQKEWNKLNTDPKKPMFNRAIRTSAPSGSIFKLVTATAGMEELGIKADTEFYDPGYYETGGVRFNNWATAGQGKLSFLEGIAWSNNTVFYKIGHQLYNKDKTILQWYAHQFGLGNKTNIDLKNESEGLVPDPEWRRNYFKDRVDKIWYPGYTINLSIGQGNLRTSPIQLVNLVSAIANGGQLYQPLLVDKIVDKDGRVIKDLKPKLLNELPVSNNTLKIVKEGMKGVTTYGTARRAFEDLPINVAGKTGTAQTGKGRPNHGWFAGFVPFEKPELAIVVFIEYGSSSANTLPIAKEIIQDYFDLELTDKDS
ncbi:penicillin-binding protein 2 [Orenia marismortui]|uniref:penicillin-binding protein 2 n=1 Tax=Orenia marismortui TaxID=46469 RepID=UPI0003809C24|nr:penicillin-binding protein 2 [Orenia marismortui]